MIRATFKSLIFLPKPSWTLSLQPCIMWISGKHVAKTKACASAVLLSRVKGSTAEPGAQALRPLPPGAVFSLQAAQWKGSLKQPIHSVGRKGTPDLILVIPVPQFVEFKCWLYGSSSPWSKEGLENIFTVIMGAAKSVSWNRKWKQPLCSLYRSLFLNTASVTLCLKCGITHVYLLLAL